MIWLNWRQFRVQALAAAVALAAIAGYLLYLGMDVGEPDRRARLTARAPALTPVAADRYLLANR